MPTKDELKMFQNYPLDMKIRKTQLRIREWVGYYGSDGVYVSFSGGKDSTVLLHLVRQMYPNVEAVFVNTGLEYPEIQSFVKLFDNVTILRPKMRFDEVIRKHGYPIIGKNVAHNVKIARNCPDGNVVKNIFNPEKRGQYAMYKWLPLASVDFLISEKCCDVMKKAPAHDFQKATGKVPILATMAHESKMRQDSWLHNGCNAFDIKNPHSAPMSFWTEQDILQYIKENSLPIASVYGDIVTTGTAQATASYSLLDMQDIFNDEKKTIEFAKKCKQGACEKLCTTGCDRTGCVFCGFGAHIGKGESRVEKLKRTHPRQYEYCLGGGAYDTDGLWKPTKDGLGMQHIFNVLNNIYGKDFIKY